MKQHGIIGPMVSKVSLGDALRMAGTFNWGKKGGANQEDAWNSLPKGWTDKSRDKYAASMAQSEGDVSSCIDKIGDNVSDPGAFCAALHDRVTGSTMWRGKQCQADSGSANTAVLRATDKKESAVGMEVKTRLKEATSPTVVPGNKFRVVLIQEGLGNMKDCFYYTKDCLQASAPLFEGIKCFADHPNQIEEQIHPERSTRDILGHYEDVTYTEADGRGALEGTLVLCEGDAFDWAKSLLTNALEYATKYPNADFVGFSINAQGEAGSAPILDFVDSNAVPASALQKLRTAMADGIDEIRPVSILKNAVSVDLVTEAGAGGKILTMMERNKKPMKPAKKTKEAAPPAPPAKKPAPAAAAAPAPAPQESHEDEADGAPAPGGQPDHTDADQDTALFQKMIKQYLGGGDDGDVDESSAMPIAKAAHEHFMKQGMEPHEAYEAAGKHLAAAAAIGKSMAAKPAEESEAHEDEAHEDESEAHEESQKPPVQESARPSTKGKQMDIQESAATKRLTAALGEMARLKESVATMEARIYVDKKIAASGRSQEFVKAFREALGQPKSQTHVESIWDLVEKAYDVGHSDAMAEDDGSVFTEKGVTTRESAKGMLGSLADCAE